MKLHVILTAAVLGLSGICGAVSAAGNIYGVSGIIETPNDLVVGKDSARMSGYYVGKFLDTGDTLTGWGGAVGLSDKAEFSWMRLDSDAAGIGSCNITSTKVAVTSESSTSPGMAVGIVDMGKDLKKFAPGIDDSSWYVVFGRTLSAELNRYSRINQGLPVRATFGMGKGIYEGVFGSLDFYLNESLEMKVEYLSKGIRDKSTLNASLNMNVMPNLSIQAGTLGFDNVFGGLSYTFSKGL